MIELDFHKNILNIDSLRFIYLFLNIDFSLFLSFLRRRIHHIAGRDIHQNRNGNELTVPKLQDLLHQDPNEITLSLASNLQSLRKFIDQPMDYGLAELFVKVLKKSIQSISLKEKKNLILSILLQSKFPLIISQLIVSINYSREAHVEFLLNLISILKTILIQNPSEYLNTLQIIGVINVILQDPNQIKVENMGNLLEKYIELQQLLQEVTKKKRNLEKEESSCLSEFPPENFRDLETVPTVETIHSEETIFLRKNKVKGAYDNVDHYLDVQFRLMREDFFGPLRDGIKQYLLLKNNQKNGHIDDLRIYQKVYILYSLCTLNGIAHKVSFDALRLPINWGQSKRLLYGSLVCLTPDDFQTIYFATVINRNIYELKEGMVDLLFFSSCEDIARLPSTTLFVMAETTAYFEAYRPILTALKQIREENMPFQDYIIYGKPQVKAPSYLIQQSHLQMDLTCLTEDCQLVFDSSQNIVTIKENFKTNLSVNILEDAWPDAEVLNLNPSQYQALQNALMKEFSLTQGPPGTGKTYVGLKIVKTLCSNCNLWRMNQKSPMLIVCYTNQALDKFLEGIASFLEGGILRVGGRSSSEVLSKYLLKNVKDSYKQSKFFSNDFMRNKYMTIQEQKDLKSEIERMTNKIKQTKQGILHEDVLENYMGQFYGWLVKSYEANYDFETNSNISVMIQWLGYGDVDILDNPDVEQEEEADLSPEENNDVLTEKDFIQHNCLLDNDSLEEEFSQVEIYDDEFIALNIKDLDGVKKFTQNSFQKTRKEKKKLKRQLQRDLNSNTQMIDDEIDQIRYHDLWLMSKKKRWELYRYWVALYCQQVREDIVQKEVEYNRVSQEYKELQQHEDGEIMKNSLIIGMTTTAAAKYYNLLQEIQPRIIIVEEAAEILEAHVVTALNPMCEQLILIGDHKQLRPNPNVYELARKYKLEVSLFERMVFNKCQVKCLSHQHRMRPEISQLLRTIYVELYDHPSVTKYEDIRGVASNVYFLQHNEPEVTNKEVSSYSNPHEAYFVVELCKYLLKQGYSQSQITILTTYTAQLFQLKNQMKQTIFKGVQLTVVDNYQGEENDIVLLSLVRNNTDRKIGFLKIDNRVCVALSRAKKGFYVFGNFEVFSEQSKLWNNILKISKSENLIGFGLTLCCQNHPDQKIQVRNGFDFNQSPEGGCLKPCESRLKCGHMCKRVCHPINDHDEYKCLEKCPKIAPGCLENHRCSHLCWEECTPCMKMVAKIIPSCNHQQIMACSENPNRVKCERPCQKHLSCGHQCIKNCGDVCTIHCKIDVNKTYPCNHTVKYPCFKQPAVCPEECSKRLNCGHMCSGICGECSDRRIHLICSHGCQRILVCGHQCTNKQCDVCLPCQKSCKNRCIHSKCIKLCGELCIPCNEPCEWRCQHYTCNRYCHESCDRPTCDRPCLKSLSCGHPCVGLCGEKCPRLCRVCDKKELTEIFFGTEEEEDACFVELEDCRHIFEKSGLDEWMSQETENEIQLKVCPKCRVPIRRNLRYGKIINKILMDINNVKEKIIGDRREISGLILQIKKDLYNLPQEYRGYLQDEWYKSKNDLSTLSYWFSFHHRITFILALCKLMKNDFQNDSLRKHCIDLSQWFLHYKGIFSESQLEEIETEMERISMILAFHEVERKFMTVGENTIKRLIQQGLQMLTSENYSRVKDDVLRIRNKISTSNPEISEQEKTYVVRSMGLPPGHWFKCPNGKFSISTICKGHSMNKDCFLFFCFLFFKLNEFFSINVNSTLFEIGLSQKLLYSRKSICFVAIHMAASQSVLQA